MPLSQTPETHAHVTARLRAAGCVFAEAEADLLLAEAKSPAELTAMVDQRVTGLPLEHIVGWAEFDGLRIAVGAGVFVPRHRTEFLVHEAAKITPPGAIVVDLCCGSGALGVALAAKVGHIQLHAADIDPIEVEYAYRNITPIGGHTYTGDLYDALPPSLEGRINILLANVPYVPTTAIELLPQEARLHEPLVSLDGGNDGLDILRRVAAEAQHWLAPGGHLFSEVSTRQQIEAARIITAAGLSRRITADDDSNAIVIQGTK